MESTEISFGRNRSIFFSIFNILQLVGWTAVMIISGAKAMNIATNTQYTNIWCIVIGIIIAFWILIGLKNISKVSLFAVGLLFLLSMFLGFIVFKGEVGTYSYNETFSFGLALELSIAMPISWLPLISDYTKNAEFNKSKSRINIIIWCTGVIIYRVFLIMDTSIGSTISVIVIVMLISSSIGLIRSEK